MAALLLDGNDDVQFAAIESLLKIYTVRADLAQRPWGVTSHRPHQHAAGAGVRGRARWRRFPRRCPAKSWSTSCSVMRQDESSRIRFAAAYALGVLGSPAMGPMNASAQPIGHRRRRQRVDAPGCRDPAGDRARGRARVRAQRGRVGAGCRGRRAHHRDERQGRAGAPVGDGFARLAEVRARRPGADRSCQLLRQERRGRGGAARGRAHRQLGLGAGPARAAGQHVHPVPAAVDRRSRPHRRSRRRSPRSTSPPPVSTTRALRWRPRTRGSCSARRTSSRSRMRWSTRTSPCRPRCTWPRSRC